MIIDYFWSEKFLLMEPTTKIFISYSWSSPDHEEWIINLAEKLMSNGIDVVFDKWDLKQGQDLNNFMEKMVTSDEIEKVLIILDKKYVEKADGRKGGVGSETQIISPKIYEDVGQEKFIPIVTEKDDDGDAYIPVYLKGRVYIDFSEEERYEESFDELLRNLLKRPKYSKPKLGDPPAYLFEETPMSFKTTILVRSFENRIRQNEKQINSFVQDFLTEFFSDLKGFIVTFPSLDDLTIGKEICDKIQSYTPLRNDFINFFNKLMKGEHTFDIDYLIQFLEKLSILEYPQNNRSSWRDIEFDNFRFYIHELFLYLIVIGMHNGNYQFLENLFYSSYFPEKKDYRNREPEQFSIFYKHIESIKPYYNQTFSTNFFSPMADLIIKRIPEPFTTDLIVEADLLCHYVGILNKTHWFPITYVYKTKGKFTFFDRLISARHFEKTKGVFNVHTAEEFKEKLRSILAASADQQQVRYYNSWDTVLPIYKMIDFERLASTR